MTEANTLSNAILKRLAEVPLTEPGRTDDAWAEIQQLGSTEELIASLQSLEEAGLIKSGLQKGADGEWALSTGILAITDQGRRQYELVR